LGNGAGSFHQPVDYESGTQPVIVAIAAEDLNGDTKIDIVVASVPDLSISHNGFGGASVLLGNGDGTFQAHVDYMTGENRDTAVDPRAVVITDFNGDSKADLVLGGRFSREGTAGPVGVLNGIGDGTFQPPIGVMQTAGPDSRSLLATSTTMAESTWLPDSSVPAMGRCRGALLLRNGDGTFSHGSSLNTQVAGCHVGTPSSSDVDGDDKLDFGSRCEGRAARRCLPFCRAGTAALA
jgi:hypothetical protein